MAVRHLWGSHTVESIVRCDLGPPVMKLQPTRVSLLFRMPSALTLPGAVECPGPGAVECPGPGAVECPGPGAVECPRWTFAVLHALEDFRIC